MQNASNELAKVQAQMLNETDIEVLKMLTLREQTLTRLMNPRNTRQ